MAVGRLVVLLSRNVGIDNLLCILLCSDTVQSARRSEKLATVRRLYPRYQKRKTDKRISAKDQQQNSFIRYERRLSAVHLVALDLLCIVDFDFSLAAVYEYDKRKEEQHYQDIFWRERRLADGDYAHRIAHSGQYDSNVAWRENNSAWNSIEPPLIILKSWNIVLLSPVPPN